MILQGAIFWHDFHTQVTKVSDCSFDFENKVLGVIPRYDLLIVIPNFFPDLRRRKKIHVCFRLVINEKKEYDASGTKEFDRFANFFNIFIMFFEFLY